jgi:hypothetical protein
VPVNVARTSFCSRSRYHRRMKRGDSVPVAICTTRTPMVTTNPSRPTIAPMTTLSTPVAVAAEYRQASGTCTVRSSQSVSSPSTGPRTAPRNGTIHRLPLSRWRARKTNPQVIVTSRPADPAAPAGPLRTGGALAPRRHLGLARRSVPPCLGTCPGGGPSLLPPELGDLAGRSLQLAHPPPGRRNGGGAEEQDAGERHEAADPDERTSCHQEAPVALNPVLGCLVSHNVTPCPRNVRQRLLPGFCLRVHHPRIILFG